MRDSEKAAVTGQSGRLRVLHVAASLADRSGGPAKMALQMCRALAARDLAVTIFTTNLDGRGDFLPFSKQKFLPAPTKRARIEGGVDIRYFQARWPYWYAFSPGMA